MGRIPVRSPVLGLTAGSQLCRDASAQVSFPGDVGVAGSSGNLMLLLALSGL